MGTSTCSALYDYLRSRVCNDAQLNAGLDSLDVMEERPSAHLLALIHFLLTQIGLLVWNGLRPDFWRDAQRNFGAGDQRPCEWHDGLLWDGSAIVVLRIVSGKDAPLMVQSICTSVEQTRSFVADPEDTTGLVITVGECDANRLERAALEEGCAVSVISLERLVNVVLEHEADGMDADFQVMMGKVLWWCAPA